MQAEIIQLYQELGSIRKVSRAIGVGDTTVSDALREAGILKSPAAEMIDEERAFRKASRRVSDGLIVRLYRYHGGNPPCEESAEAARRLRATIIARQRAAETEKAKRRKNTYARRLAKIWRGYRLYLKRRRIERHGLTPHDILIEVAQKHGLTPTEMRSVRKTTERSIARFEFFWRCNKETTASLKQICRVLACPERPNGPDHTTVINGIRRHQERIDAGLA